MYICSWCESWNQLLDFLFKEILERKRRELEEKNKKMSEMAQKRAELMNRRVEEQRR